MNKSIYYDEEAYRIAINWYEKGTEEEDSVFAFVSFWIVMNQLYNYGQLRTESDRVRLNEYIKRNKEDLIKIIDFDAEYLDVFMENPVLDGKLMPLGIDWSNPERQIRREADDIMGNFFDASEVSKIVRNHLLLIDDETNKHLRIKVLFSYIYSVRCNLLHGNKSLDSERNWRLINSSAEILRICLPTLIKTTFRR